MEQHQQTFISYTKTAQLHTPFELQLFSKSNNSNFLADNRYANIDYATTKKRFKQITWRRSNIESSFHTNCDTYGKLPRLTLLMHITIETEIQPENYYKIAAVDTLDAHR